MNTVSTERVIWWEYPCGAPAHRERCPAADMLHAIANKKENIQRQKEHPEEILHIWNVPKKHLKSSFENFKGGEAAKKICGEAAKHSESVLLCGKTGCGKTHLAVSMLRQKTQHSTIELEPKNNNKHPKAIFITVPELLLEIRQSYNNPNIQESDIVDKYSDVQLLVLDDLGAEKTTEWSESTLYIIIDRRNRNERWTIVTSNLTLPEIETHLGARIASRLSDMKVVNIKLPDYRKRRSEGIVK